MVQTNCTQNTHWTGHGRSLVWLTIYDDNDDNISTTTISVHRDGGSVINHSIYIYIYIYIYNIIMTSSIATIAVLSSCGFLGNFGAALLGFGEAIIFLFVWQVIYLAGYDDTDFKFAIFIQSLSLFSVQPFLLWETSVVKYAHRRILLLFVPVTLLLTPIGQYVGTIAPIPLMKTIAGAVVLFVAFIETHTRRHALLRRCRGKGVAETTIDNTHGAPPTSIEVSTDDPAQRGPPDDADASAAVDEEDFPIESTRLSLTFGITSCNPSEHRSDSATDDRAGDAVSNNTAAARDTHGSNDGSTEKRIEMIVFGCNRVTSDTVVAGGLSGFLGGMIGIRTPPLMLYFLHPPKPLVFDNHSQRATGVVIMFTSTVFREVFYLYDTFAGDDAPGYQGGVVVYQREDWKLYVHVVVFSILGGWVGGRAFEYVKNAREAIRGIFLVLLYMCGASLFISAFTA
ncbi:hypothetical protein ACHAXA_007366 [Cyclostephanos tholiformis]|uniref:Uncharacterized protein n=1 Tax=Cyclostephanos tholiformis TaxID=382380 RepID=A0ABD3RW59_9STRA